VDHGWGQGWGAAQGGRILTGISGVLDGYAHRGGQLSGARRWAENPLTLTHVRWIGPAGEQLEATRSPGDDSAIDASERDVWVQLALGFPAMHPSPAGRDAPWLPLAVSPRQAATLLGRLPRVASLPPLDTPGMRDDGFLSGPRPSGWSGTPSPVFSGPSVHSGPTGSPEWSGDLRDAVLYDEGISVIVCVEIELPPVAGLVTPDVADTFVRDAAATFVRAVRGLQNVREMRAWRRGGRLVLAVRIIVAPGSGVSTRQEDDEAMRALARALAQETLPYLQLALAPPGEWTRGQPLPA
jgi:hypothetical protein